MDHASWGNRWPIGWIQGVFLFAASCESQQKCRTPASYFLLGRNSFYTKSCLCNIYISTKCCFSNLMPLEDPKNWIYYNLKYLSPLLTQFLNEQCDTWVEFLQGKWHPGWNSERPAIVEPSCIADNIKISMTLKDEYSAWMVLMNIYFNCVITHI